MAKDAYPGLGQRLDRPGPGHRKVMLIPGCLQVSHSIGKSIFSRKKQNTHEQHQQSTKPVFHR
jgi:hypothetical protein